MAGNVNVESVSPDRVDDFVRFFDGAFADNPHWAGCFCAYYDDPCADDDWRADAVSAPRNRARKVERLRSGESTGLLAYLDGEPVGWCNAGPRASLVNLRSYAAAVVDPHEAVGCIMCFVVHPDHRQRGVGSAMLAAADDHFRRLGLTVAEGYPSIPRESRLPWSAFSYHGTRAMFEKAGYVVREERDTYLVMRKAL